MSSIEPNPASQMATSEALRKAVHIAFGFVAIALYWLSWEAALALAAAAFVFNWVILPWTGGRLISRAERGSDIGILLYPAAIFVSILLFRDSLHIAGAIWVILAFGDGSASLIGRNLGGPRLPWNRRKSLLGSLAFIEVALPAAYFLVLFLGPPSLVIPLFIYITLAVVAAAVAESLDLGVDDNITVPLVAGFTLWWIEQWVRIPPITLEPGSLSWLGINLLLATVGLMAGSIDRWGWLGGVMIGSLLILFGGWPIYVVLLLFFILGTVSTRLGYASKAARGIAQEKSGRRGFHHAFANCGVALICIVSIAFIEPGLLWVGAVAAFATAAADTLSSEIGKWLGRRAFLPLTFRPVPPGTDGAVSIVGTLAGVAGAFVVAAAGILLLAWKDELYRTLPFQTGLERLASGYASPVLWQVIGLTALAAVAGMWLESVVGSRFRGISNGALNFFNTAAGALIAMGLIVWSGVAI